MSNTRAKPPKNMTGKTVDGIRPGQCRPYRKATNVEIQERVEWLALTVAIQPTLKDGELKAMAKEKFNLHWTTALIYIHRAKKLLADRANITKEQAKKIGVNALLDTILNGNASERNAALRLWFDMFGLDAAKQFRLGDPDGKPIAPAVIAPQVHLIIPSNGRE
jgi:hypothetical protein